MTQMRIVVEVSFIKASCLYSRTRIVCCSNVIEEEAHVSIPLRLSMLARDTWALHCKVVRIVVFDPLLCYGWHVWHTRVHHHPSERSQDGVQRALVFII